MDLTRCAKGLKNKNYKQHNMEQLAVIPVSQLQALIRSEVQTAVEAIRNTPVLTEPNPTELWTAQDIAQCGGGAYGRVLDKIRNGKVRTFKKGGRIAIQYKSIQELGITVNPFLKK